MLDLLAALDVRIPESRLALEMFTPFATVFRYDDMPLENAIAPQA